MTTAGVHRLALETLVGSSKSRAEPGETLVAIKFESQSGFRLIQPVDSRRAPVGLNDESIDLLREHMEGRLREIDDRHRRIAASSLDEYWVNRHKLAQAWAKKQVVIVPGSDRTPIDAFIEHKIQTAQALATESKSESAQFFHNQIKPILQDNCLRCHGSKAEGGLKLTTRDLA